MRQLKGATNQELEDSPVFNKPCVESFTNYVSQLPDFTYLYAVITSALFHMAKILILTKLVLS